MGNSDQDPMDQSGSPCSPLESWSWMRGLKQSPRYQIPDADSFETLQSSPYGGAPERSSSFPMWPEIETAENMLPNYHHQQEQRMNCTDFRCHTIHKLAGRRTETALSPGCPSCRCSLLGLLSSSRVPGSVAA